MKRCPECRRDYHDDTLSFCLADGTELVYGLSDDEPETALLSESGRASVWNVSPRRNSIIGGILGILLVTALGIGSYFYYGRGSTKQIESIAVMPFVNESGNPEIEYVSDGITETLINRLSQLPSLGVQASSSVFRGRVAMMRRSRSSRRSLNWMRITPMRIGKWGGYMRSKAAMRKAWRRKQRHAQAAAMIKAQL